MLQNTLQRNPGLERFDISDYNGVHDCNFFDTDTVLKFILDKHTILYSPRHKEDMMHHLSGFGSLCGGILNKLSNESQKEGKYGDIINFDSTGNRVDKIDYCFEQTEIRRIAYEHGIVNLDFHETWQHDFTLIHKMALGYLANQNGESGYTCPLAMTDGMISVLKALATDDQKKRFLPLVAGQGSHSHFMCGQYVTERVGGSNVAQNRTVAREQNDGTWILNGEKWFCSNPGDLWVTTARIENTNTIGMFLVSRYKKNGELNGCHLLRKKDIIGSRGKLTAEVVYENLEAEPLGRPSHGLANLLKYVIFASRIHVSISALGMSRRSFLEARNYVKCREAYGKKIFDFPIVKRQLAEMQILHVALGASIFKNYTFIENKKHASELLTPLLKFISTIHGTWITHEAMMLHGGNGILGDFSPLPRLHNDAIINETWEGTHHIICEHVYKAFRRRKIQNDFILRIQENLNDAKGHLRDTIAFNQECLEQMITFKSKSKDWMELNLQKCCENFYQTFALSEILTFSNKENDNYHLIAKGYSEIIRRGIMGSSEDGGIFDKVDYLDRIISL